MKTRVELIQTRFFEERSRTMDALMELIADIKSARERGVPDGELKPAWEAQRRGQFYLDMVESENSTGFHAPQESMRVLVEAMDALRKGQIAIRSTKIVARKP